MNLKLNNTALTSGLVATCGAIVLLLLFLFLISTRLPIASITSIQQSWPEAMVHGYAGGKVMWSEFTFNCGGNKISFESWTHKVELPGKCPKDNKGLMGAFEELLKEATRLKFQSTSLFSELDTWIRYLRA
ncbi:MAG: hypothetical protein AAB508_05390, partial [Patescibacteria group bacterium]